MRNEKGISMPELIMATAMAAVLSIGLVRFSGDISKQSKKFEERVEDIVDQSAANDLVFNDIKNSSASFFFFNIQGKKLSRFNSNVNGCIQDIANDKHDFWNLTKKDLCLGYEITLKEVGQKFVFLRTNPISPVDTILVNPIELYDADASNLVFNNNKLKSILSQKGLDKIQLFKFQSPDMVVSEGKLQNYAVIYNVESAQLIKDDFYTIPKDHCMVETINNLDTFLKCMPGRGIRKVLISPVIITQYTLEDTQIANKNVRVFKRKTSRDGTKYTDVAMANNVSQIQFYRKNTALPLLSFKLEVR